LEPGAGDSAEKKRFEGGRINYVGEGVNQKFKKEGNYKTAEILFSFEPKIRTSRGQEGQQGGKGGEIFGRICRGKNAQEDS